MRNRIYKSQKEAAANLIMPGGIPKVKGRKLRKGETYIRPPRVGRPGIYGPDKVETAAHVMRLGATMWELANCIGCDVQTVHEWAHTHPEFAQALKLGKEASDERVVNSMYHRAVGYNYETEKIFQYQGKPVRVPYTEHVPPDVTVGTWWLGNRQPKLWGSHAEEETISVKEARNQLLTRVFGVLARIYGPEGKVIEAQAKEIK